MEYLWFALLLQALLTLNKDYMLQMAHTPTLHWKHVSGYIENFLKKNAQYTIEKLPKPDGAVFLKNKDMGTDVLVAYVKGYELLKEEFRQELLQSLLKSNHPLPSKVAQNVIATIKKREEAGFKEYGKTLDRTDFTLEQWVNEALEEAMDLTLYLQKVKLEIQNYMLLSEQEKRMIEAYRKSQN